MIRGGNWQPTCRLIKPLPRVDGSPTRDINNIADLEIVNVGVSNTMQEDQPPYRIGDNQHDPDYNHALEFLHDQITKIEVTID